MWVLRIEPGHLGKAGSALTAESLFLQHLLWLPRTQYMKAKHMKKLKNNKVGYLRPFHALTSFGMTFSPSYSWLLPQLSARDSAGTYIVRLKVINSQWSCCPPSGAFTWRDWFYSKDHPVQSISLPSSHGSFFSGFVILQTREPMWYHFHLPFETGCPM